MTLPTLSATDAYHLARLTPGWAEAQTATKNAAITRASDFIVATYTLRPDADPDDQRFSTAIMALAAHALTSTLVEAEAVRDIVESEKTGDGLGSVVLTYGERNVDRYPHITRMLAPVAYLIGTEPGRTTIVTGKMAR